MTSRVERVGRVVPGGVPGPPRGAGGIRDSGARSVMCSVPEKEEE